MYIHIFYHGPAAEATAAAATATTAALLAGLGAIAGRMTHLAAIKALHAAARTSTTAAWVLGRCSIGVIHTRGRNQLLSNLLHFRRLFERRVVGL